MNLLEALKTGKPYRRKGWKDTWYKNDWINHNSDVDLSVEDALSEDWEVEERVVTITESDFNKAVARTGNLYYQDQWYWAAALKKELGL